jgi:hypothetical protein
VSNTRELSSRGTSNPCLVVKIDRSAALRMLNSRLPHRQHLEWPFGLSLFGKGTAVNGPVGLGGKGNAGVAGQVRQTGGAIGCVDFLYAAQNRMPYGAVLNSAGRFSSGYCRLAAAGALSRSLTDFSRIDRQCPRPAGLPGFQLQVHSGAGALAQHHGGRRFAWVFDAGTRTGFAIGGGEIWICPTARMMGRRECRANSRKFTRPLWQRLVTARGYFF